MSKTSTPIKKHRAVNTAPRTAEWSGNRQSGYHHALPAKYAGMPNFMQYCIGPGAELEEAALLNADLRWSNFRGANLKKAKLKGSILWGSILTNADLTGADLCGADFTGVDLVGTDLSDSAVEGTCFLGARYSKATRFPKGFGNPEAKGMVSLNESLQLTGYCG